MDFKGKNIVYVGGFGGIGFTTCKLFAEKGAANLFILDLVKNDDFFSKLKSISSGNVYFKEVNLMNKYQIEEAIKHVVSTIKYFDILVNGSGIANDRKPDQTIGINLTGLITTTLIAIPYMDQANGGRGGIIVNIASVLGLVPEPSLAMYTASKYGVVGFSRAIASEYYYKRTGIAVITICPGITSTNLVTDFKDVDTFPYSGPLAEKFISAKKQSADECATNLIEAIKTAKNGSVWILDLGELREANMVHYWSSTY